jgi:conjugal transfer pilus assembly protein TraE
MKKEESLVRMSMTDFEQSKKFNRMMIGGLTAICLCLTIMLTTKETEIVVMPAIYDQEIKVQGNRANEHYMTRHGFGIASLIGNINERNAPFVMTTMLDMMSPYLRSQLEDGLLKEVQILKIRKANQSFVIEDMMYEPKNNLIWVWGTKTLSIKSGSKAEERWTYELRIEPRNGSPVITHFDSYAGTPKQKNNDEYTVDNSPYLDETLDRVMNDPRNAENTRKIETDKPAKPTGTKPQE